MALTYRQTKGSALTIQELDANFQYFTGSQAITGSLIVTQAITASSFSGSFTGSFLGTSSYATQALSASYAPNSGATVSTASLLTTASATNNVITFTKGDASTFAVTVATGSGGGSTNTGSLLTTASATNNVITFTKGDASTFSVTVATGSATTVSTGSLLVTASVSNATTTYTKGDGSTFTTIVNNVVNSTSASYFSGSSGGATFTGDVNFTSGANVDGLFVVIPTDDSSVTSGLQVQRGEASPGDVQYTAINYQGGAGRLVGVNQHNNTPQLFIMLQDASANVSMMEFKTVFEAGIASAFIKINTSVLPTSEPSTSGQLWLSGSAGANSKLLAVRN